MKRLLCLTAALVLLAAFSVPQALAQAAPDEQAADAEVKGLWLKATGLPKGAHLEDMTQEDDEPYFIYSFGEGPDGPAVTIPVGRYPQNDERAEKFLALDPKGLADFVGSENFTETAKDLQFTDAPKFSEKFTYPCQTATYTDSDMGLRFMYLFIQTDGYMFSALVCRNVDDSQYSDADAEKWLMGLEFVEQ